MRRETHAEFLDSVIEKGKSDQQSNRFKPAQRLGLVPANIIYLACPALSSGPHRAWGQKHWNRQQNRCRTSQGIIPPILLAQELLGTALMATRIVLPRQMMRHMAVVVVAVGQTAFMPMRFAGTTAFHSL